MAYSDLQLRLNVKEYTNWLRAQLCLNSLASILRPYVIDEMSAFHKDLIRRNASLSKQCKASCRSIAKQCSQLCAVCTTWKSEILSHHRQPNATVHWDNCVPSDWRTNHLEVAKAFMPRGQWKVKAAAEFDISALLNLINYCDWFHSVDLDLVREMIRHRNDMSHCPDLHLTDEWMKRYERTLKNLLHQFSHVPEMATAKQQIDEMLTVDLSMIVGGSNQVDSTNENMVVADFDRRHRITADLIIQWERELLQERLEELLDDMDDTNTQDDDQLKSLGHFLHNNKDLGGHFSKELQTIKSLWKRK